jgi:hypothetical protein
MGDGFISSGIKRTGRETDHSSPSNAEVKNAWRYTSAPQYVFMAWYLVKLTVITFAFTLLYLLD